MPITTAAGAVRDGKLLLVPVDGALQLRPSMAHLNEEAKAAGRHAAAEEEEEEKPFERQTVKVGPLAAAPAISNSVPQKPACRRWLLYTVARAHL